MRIKLHPQAGGEQFERAAAVGLGHTLGPTLMARRWVATLYARSRTVGTVPRGGSDGAVVKNRTVDA